MLNFRNRIADAFLFAITVRARKAFSYSDSNATEYYKREQIANRGLLFNVLNLVHIHLYNIAEQYRNGER